MFYGVKVWITQVASGKVRLSLSVVLTVKLTLYCLLRVVDMLKDQPLTQSQAVCTLEQILLSLALTPGKVLVLSNLFKNFTVIEATVLLRIVKALLMGS